MPAFGTSSQERLATCHSDLQRVLNSAIKDGPDFTVLCGHRTKVDQDKAIASGASKAPWPTSKHNSNPSMAVDIAPYPIDWDDLNKFRFLAGYVMGVAASLDIKIRWGGDWNKNYDEGDEKFRDFPHIELVT